MPHQASGPGRRTREYRLLRAGMDIDTSDEALHELRLAVDELASALEKCDRLLRAVRVPDLQRDDTLLRLMKVLHLAVDGDEPAASPSGPVLH
jgi:hypothetical protein